MKELLLTAPRQLVFCSYTERDLQKGEVLLRTLCSGISAGTELRRYRGQRSTKHWDRSLRLYDETRCPEQWPIALGYETVARVVALGPGVETVRVGSVVWVDHPHRDTHIVSEQEARYGLLLLPEEAKEQTLADLERFVFMVRTR